ncbi:hypothetical protein SSBR45G_16470 [Bradyrhizobium sp. SSBR45G]|nr:hypothetical protein SSBR45G_16470 [Bradyrhizobium sp. SSBR45G]GLH83497.1 hypothetical protein SSBR45R_09570 [Bradyrhizobium sp. SSBR45R]
MYRYITLLGVLEYVHDPEFVLDQASQRCSILLLDYSSQGSTNERRNCGWVNDLTPGEAVNALIRTNWRHICLRKVIDNRYLYICESKINGSEFDWGHFVKRGEAGEA